MKTYRFRILLDTPQHVFRDIDINADATFEALHEAILNSFSFSGKEMASFYLSNDDWDKGDEIALMDFSEPGQSDVRTMERTSIDELLTKEGDKVLYLYDFFRMWIWFVEVVKIFTSEPTEHLPKVVLAVGDAPSEYSKKIVESFDYEESEDGEDPYGDFDDDYDEGDLDGFETESFQ